MSRLRDYASNVTSMSGEDGMLAEIFRRMDVQQGWCVEFGAWDGKHLSNTWTLWSEQGWNAVLIEGDPTRCRDLVLSTADLHRVTAREAFVTTDGPNSLDAILAGTDIPAEFELLSVDIDGDDYWVWNALKNYRPKVVVVEYNPSFGTDIAFIQDPGEYIGSSALSMHELATAKGYALVALTDTNLVLLRADLLETLDLTEVPLDDEYKASLRVIAYSDLGGRHHLLQTGPWGFTGIKTNHSPIKARYSAYGRKVYRRLSRFPRLQKAILNRANPTAYSSPAQVTVDLRNVSDLTRSTTGRRN